MDTNKLLDTSALNEIKKYIKEIQLDDVILYAIKPTDKNVWIDLMNNFIYPKYREGFPLHKIIISAAFSSGWGHKGLFMLDSIVLPEDIEDSSSSSIFSARECSTTVDMERWGNNPSYKDREKMYVQTRRIEFTVKQTGITAVDATESKTSTTSFLATDINYPKLYQPQYPGSPATKKYVDDTALTLQRKPVIIYDDPTGFEASNSDVGNTWHLENLDLSKYKRLKFYVKAAGDTNDNRTPSHIVEMHLDDRTKGDSAFTAGHMSANPNNRNRIHCVTFAVNNEKTAIQFVAAHSLYGTANTSSSGGRNCYLIEGYYD